MFGNLNDMVYKYLRVLKIYLKRVLHQRQICYIVRIIVNMARCWLVFVWRVWLWPVARFGIEALWIWNMGCGVWNFGLWALNFSFGTRDAGLVHGECGLVMAMCLAMGHGAWDMEHGIWGLILRLGFGT